MHMVLHRGVFRRYTFTYVLLAVGTHSWIKQVLPDKLKVVLYNTNKYGLNVTFCVFILLNAKYIDDCLCTLFRNLLLWQLTTSIFWPFTFLQTNRYTNHSLGLGFKMTLLPIGFFLFLIAPSSSDPHHHMKLSHMEIWRQTATHDTMKHGSYLQCIMIVLLTRYTEGLICKQRHF